MEKYNNYWAFERFTYCTPGVSYLTGSVLSVLVIMPQAHSCTHRIRWRSKQPSLHTHHSAEGRASEWSNNRHIMSTHFWVKVNLKSAITDFFFFQLLEHSGEKLRKHDWHNLFTSACMLASCGLFANPTNTEQHKNEFKVVFMTSWWIQDQKSPSFWLCFWSLQAPEGDCLPLGAEEVVYTDLKLKGAACCKRKTLQEWREWTQTIKGP